MPETTHSSKRIQRHLDLIELQTNGGDVEIELPESPEEQLELTTITSLLGLKNSRKNTAAIESLEDRHDKRFSLVFQLIAGLGVAFGLAIFMIATTHPGHPSLQMVGELGGTLIMAGGVFAILAGRA